MDGINYLKLDLKLIKESIKYFAIVPAIFVVFMIWEKQYNLMSSYLCFFLIIFATIPFSIQGNEKSTQMYYMFPCKISSMVLGRFLCLISIAFIIFLIDGSIVAYMYKIDIINKNEIVGMFLLGIMSLITCLIQYPIYYRFGFEKGKAISMVTYLIPAFAIFSLPSFVVKSDFLEVGKLESSFKFIMNNVSILVTFSVLIVIIIGYISYLASCKICKKKEV